MMDKPQVRKLYYTKIMDFYRYNNIYVPFLNHLIRALQGRKAASHIKKIGAQASGLEEEIAKWYEEHNYFFGFGVPRSGTTFLANFLNSNIQGAIILHEPNVNDYWHFAKALQTEQIAESYISDYRLKEIYLRIKPYTFGTYGEINPMLRMHCRAIRKALPEAKMFQVVRHPASVIRSLMSREQLGFKDPMKKVIFPAADDPYAGEWKHWGRFEKFCWMWSHDNRIMRKTCRHIVRFEDLRKSYEYFSEQILNYLGLEMDEATWERGINKVNNRTPQYKFPKYEEWSSAQKTFLQNMCGEEMAYYNY